MSWKIDFEVVRHRPLHEGVEDLAGADVLAEHLFHRGRRAVLE